MSSGRRGSRHRLLHELGASRTGAVRYLTALPEDRRAQIAGRLPGRVADWLAAGPVVILDGLAAGLLIETGGAPLSHAHIGSIVRGNLEPAVQEALRRTLPADGVLYDVGSNIGFFALAGARLAGAGGHVYAFEPVPASAAAIRRNAELNGLQDSVTVLEKAAADASGEGKLLVVGEASWSHLESTGRHADVREELTVELIRLDDVVGDLQPPDVIKLDTEGAEVAVLEGACETLDRHRPAIVCECHDNTERVVELLISMGYSVENIDSAVPVDQAPDDAHLLARHAG